MKKILIVDGDESNVTDIRNILTDEKFEIFVSGDGMDATSYARKIVPDLILMSIELPLLNGFYACENLKSDPDHAISDVPVIFLSSYLSSSRESQGIAVGGTDFIYTPVEREVLLHRIELHLDLVHVSLLETSHHDAVKMISQMGHINDEDTGKHVQRMSSYSQELAKLVGWTDEDAEMLFYAASLHDAGKVGIPHEILKKNNKLTEEEFNIMKMHTVKGNNILSTSQAPIFQLAADVAYSHHEKWDGTGYPRGLKHDQISLAARIVTIADVFDALTTTRPYKTPWTIEKTVEFISSQKGKHFDPELVDVFLSNLSRFVQIKDSLKD